MRIVVVLALSLCALVVRAEPLAPIGKLEPPEGRFFDEPFAVSPDGKHVAAIATDAATSAALFVWSAPGATAMAGGLPIAITSVSFVTADRILVVAKQEGSDQVVGQLATLKDGKGQVTVSFDKNRLGPATAIDVIGEAGKPLIAVYKLGGKKSPEHAVQILDGTTLKPVARRTLLETDEGLLRTRSGEIRVVWWANGHTHIGGQKIGAYDKARDIRTPNRFVRLDLVTDKLTDEREIEDVMGFANLSLVRKAGPPEEAFARLSDDRRAVLLVDGLDERTLPLARDPSLYEPTSLRWQILDEKALLVAIQIDPNNAAAIARRAQDPDDLELYRVDRASLHGGAVSARRILVLPGGGRPASFSASGAHVGILRKHKGFDRGGVVIELYALP